MGWLAFSGGQPFCIGILEFLMSSSGFSDQLSAAAEI